MQDQRQMEKLREVVERELNIEDTGSFLDEELNKEEITDEEENAEADDMLQILPNKGTDEYYDED